MADYQERVSGWLEPIVGDLPAGPEARYDIAYEYIRDQVASLDTPTGGQVIWPEILSKGEALLTTQSKDLLIASYSAYGLYQTEGLNGLASGLWLIAEIADRYWEAGWPKLKRIRARVNAIDWLTERVNQFLPDTQVGSGDQAAVKALKEAAARLSEVVTERFGDSAPKMRPLRESITRLELSLPDGGEASAEEAPPTDAPQQAPAPEPEAPAEALEKKEEDAPELNFDERLDEFSAPYLEPISADAPAGQDARYEVTYDEVRTIVGQLDTPTGGAVDWAEVERLATDLLKGKSKDCLMAAYVACAMFERRGFEGLAQGAAVLAGVFDIYWDDGFPDKRRVRARANAAAWLISRVDSLAEQTVEASDREAVLLLEASAKRLADVITARFEDKAPAVRPLLDSVQRVILSIPEPEPEPEAPAPQAAQAAAQPKTAAQPTTEPRAATKTRVSMPSVPADTADVSNLAPFLKKVGASLHQAARGIFKADKANPTSYRLSRLGLLLYMEGAPPPITGQQTGVPAPSADLTQQLDGLTKAQNWAMLLEEAESAMGPNRFWLDLHRYVIMALSGLGYDEARTAVVAATASLLGRMPGVAELQFNSGQPFASAATKEWFETEVVVASEAGSGDDGLSDEERGHFDEARKLAAAGKVSEVVELLDEVSATARSGAVQFRARLAMGQACAAAGAHAAADGVFSSLITDIDEHKLERWDPQMVAGCYMAHYEVLKGLAIKVSKKRTGDPLINQRMSHIYTRLCRVSPSAALKIAG